MIVYLITNVDNGKMYIGKTERSFNERWKAHCYDSFHNRSKTYFHRAIRKHGKQSFTHQILTEARNRMELDEAEIHFIALYQTYNPEFGYNGSLGGTGGVLNEESRKKLSGSLKGRKRKPTSEETKEKIRIANTGKVRTQEAKDRMKESCKKRNKTISDETRLKMSLSKKGRTLSDEHKIKIGASQKGKIVSLDTKLKMSLSSSGRKHSEETKNRLREIRIKYYKDKKEMCDNEPIKRKRKCVY